MLQYIHIRRIAIGLYFGIMKKTRKSSQEGFFCLHIIHEH